VLYGLHQVFTKLASERIGDGLGGFIVEISAALIIALYLVYLKFFSEWKQPVTTRGDVLLRAEWPMCGSGNRGFLSAVSEGRTAFGCADGACGRRGVDGCHWNPVL
jgi:hypothetical protein